jgi:hypothetical protein
MREWKGARWWTWLRGRKTEPEMMPVRKMAVDQSASVVVESRIWDKKGLAESGKTCGRRSSVENYERGERTDVDEESGGTLGGSGQPRGETRDPSTGPPMRRYPGVWVDFWRRGVLLAVDELSELGPVEPESSREILLQLSRDFDGRCMDEVVLGGGEVGLDVHLGGRNRLSLRVGVDRLLHSRSSLGRALLL